MKLRPGALMFAKPRGFLSLRWWRTTGLIFSACCFLGFWASFGLAVYGILSRKAESPIAIAAFLTAGLFLTILLPAGAAIALGTVIEARRPQVGPLPPVQRVIGLLQAVGSFLLAPVAIMAWHGATQFGAGLMESGFEAKNNPPIVSGDQVGFC